MTTNIDRAVHVINETYADEYVRAHMTPAKVVAALNDAALLAPDLPEVKFNQFGVWENCGVDVYPGWGAVDLYAATMYGEMPETLTPDEARETAYALLAAANYAENHQETP